MPRRRKRPRKSYAIWIGLGISLILFCVPLVAGAFSFFIPYAAFGVASALQVILWLVILTVAFRPEVEQVPVLLGCGTLAVLVACAAILGLVYLVVNLSRASYLESSGLKARLVDYVTAGVNTSSTGPALHGKVVILERGDGTINYEFTDRQFLLPAELLPRSDAEVGTVILIDWQKTDTGGKYESGAPGKMWSVNLACIDYRNKVKYYTGSYTGSAPPDKIIKGSVAGTGSKPEAEVEHWITSVLQSPR